mgnify:CR=1 FL=1
MSLESFAAEVRARLAALEAQAQQPRETSWPVTTGANPFIAPVSLTGGATTVSIPDARPTTPVVTLNAASVQPILLFPDAVRADGSHPAILDQHLFAIREWLAEQYQRTFDLALPRALFSDLPASSHERLSQTPSPVVGELVRLGVALPCEVPTVVWIVGVTPIDRAGFAWVPNWATPSLNLAAVTNPTDGLVLHELAHLWLVSGQHDRTPVGGGFDPYVNVMHPEACVGTPLSRLRFTEADAQRLRTSLHLAAI